MSILENLSWRYSTKKFDVTKKISQIDIEKIEQAILLAPTSYGLQPFKVLIITDTAVREKLKPASWNQPQISDCSHLLVFCSYTNMPNQYVDDFLSLKEVAQELEKGTYTKAGEFMKSKLNEFSAEEKKLWAKKQTYLALENLLLMCAELKIDACPMEGFEPEKYSEILELDKKGLTASVIAAIGYRSPDDKYQHMKKFRLPKEMIFENI